MVGNGNAMIQARSVRSIVNAVVGMDLRGTRVVDGIGSQRESCHVARAVCEWNNDWMASSSNLPFKQSTVPFNAFVGSRRS